MYYVCDNIKTTASKIYLSTVVIRPSPYMYGFLNNVYQVC